MKQVHILGIPMDLGQQRRGVDMGPSALRYAGLQSQIESLEIRVVDHGNLTVPNPEESVAASGNNRLQVVAQVCDQIFNWGKQQPISEDLALFLGGDHSISIGSVKAAIVNDPEHTGLIWIDAHPDFNTPNTSPSGNLHGMPVAVVTGDGHPSLVELGDSVRIPAANIVQIGIRSVDPDERVRIHQSKLCIYTMREIDTRGMATIATDALAHLDHCRYLHISLDLDSLDPSEAPGVGTPVRGGLSYREAHLLCEILSGSGKVCSIDVVENNPILDEKNQTAELAVELIASLLGKQIL
ncbi:arginase [Chloroflexi bacterium TSY]|nr:arginase [Chloroflexi bacterium TSY]